MCNKIWFAEKWQAQEHIKIAIAGSRRSCMKQNGDKLKELKPYKCPRCDLWHLTTSKKLKGSQKKAYDKSIEKMNGRG